MPNVFAHCSSSFFSQYEKLVPGRRIASAANKTLELFYSFRSPYSQIIVRRARQLAKHYGVPLIIRPIMPMLMRGLPVSKNKSRYILFDTGAWFNVMILLRAMLVSQPSCAKCSAGGSAAQPRSLRRGERPAGRRSQECHGGVCLRADAEQGG